MTTWNYNYRIYPVKGILYSQPVLEAHGKGAIAIICFVRGRYLVDFHLFGKWLAGVEKQNFLSARKWAEKKLREYQHV